MNLPNNIVLVVSLLLVAGPVFWLWLSARRQASRERARRAVLEECMDVTASNFAVFDRNRMLIACNDAYRELHAAAFARLGNAVRYDDLMRAACQETMPAHEVEAEVARRIANHEACVSEGFDRLYPGGRWLRVAKRRLSGGYVAGFAMDITPLKTREAELEASQARYRALVDDAPVGLWQLDGDGRTLFVNGHAIEILGGKAPATLGECGLTIGKAGEEVPFDLVAGRRVDVRLPRPGGLDATVLIVASPWLVGADGRSSILLTLLDVTALKLAQAEIERLARVDPLTGLANRNAFRAQLQAVVDGPGGTLLLIDLDRFKQTNDRHGHGAGDALLVAIAGRLASLVRPADLCCRLGGDEFAVVLVGADAAAATAIARRIARAIAEPVAFEGAELSVGASIGMALAPDHGTTVDALNRAADLALYRSKATRRGEPMLFEPTLGAVAERRALVREALSAALANDELRLVFQPQCNMTNGALVGAEALLRWHSRRLGAEVPVAELLDVATEARLMPAIDDWVLETAVARLAAWRDLPGAPPVLSINISDVSLRDPRFAERVATCLLIARVPASRLEIEVPESIAVRDIDTLQDNLIRLRAIGVRLALDDFGAGLSSLQHVVRLPVHRLKLDRSIVAALEGPEASRGVLRATVALARGMNIEVLVEGVETETQADELRREGLALAQGWLYGRPMEEADFIVVPATRQVDAA